MTTRLSRRRGRTARAVVCGRSVRLVPVGAYAHVHQQRHFQLGRAAHALDHARAHGVHRVGALTIGDLAVWVGVSAAHRGAAFDACRFIIDEAKARVPIWKKEHYADGTSEWVNCATRGEFARLMREQ